MKSHNFTEPDDGTAEWCLRKMQWDWEHLPASLAQAIILKEDEVEGLKLNPGRIMNVTDPDEYNYDEPADRGVEDEFLCNYCGKSLGMKGHTWTQCSTDKPRQSVTEIGYGYSMDVAMGRKTWEEHKAEWHEKHPDEKGMKFSSGKPKWQYMAPLWPAMSEVVKVLSRGAEKYEENNWMEVDRDEYIRAIMSHYSAYSSGERIDPDMGSNHMANLICSALFLLWHDGIK